MEHFSVVQSIIRAGLAEDREAFQKQIARLHTRLLKSGLEKEAATVERLLNAAVEVKNLEPSRVEISRNLIAGELLNPEIHPPIDRETGARLCTIEFPLASNTPPPVYDGTIKQTIEDLLSEWSNAMRLKQLGVEPTRTLLIFGPPGSGKTFTAYYIAQKLRLPLVIARIDGLISSFLGTTARNIANLFEFANRYGCLLLLDEFDALAKLRDDPHEIGEIKRVVNTLLQNLDLRREFGITIAITNHERLLDPAVWRRFETQIHIAEPGDGARESLIERFLAPVKTDSSLIKIFSYCLKGRSGADIRRLCDSVKRTVALGGRRTDAPGLFEALSAVLSRLPSHDHIPAELLARNVDDFISYAANDKDLALTQTQFAEVSGKTQSTISRLKSLGPVVRIAEAAFAQ